MSKNIKVLTQEEIHKPNPGLILEAPLDEDWVLGHPVLGATIERVVLQPDKDWTPHITEYELQRNSFFDAYDCVTQSAWNKIQCLAHRQYNDHLDKSKRWTAIKSGTKPGVGNSVKNVVECIRKMGGVPEEAWVSMSDTMRQSEFFSPIPAEVDAKEDFLGKWEYNHEWLPVNYIGATIANVVDSGLPYSPVMISIEGDYEFDAQGRLQYHGLPYSHEVLIVASKPDCFLVLDSENPKGLMKVRRDYAFVGPKIGYLKKKSMFQLIKEDGSPAVYLQVASGNLYGIADSEEITGGEALKCFSGDYKGAGIKHVPAGTLDKSKIVGEYKAVKFGLLSNFFS